VVGEGIVYVASLIDVSDTVVVVFMGPNYKMNGGKYDTGSAELAKAGAEVGMSVRGIDMGILFINCPE
ncbi:hypothetical protein KI387_004339, partial [Taxus chinensis]